MAFVEATEATLDVRHVTERALDCEGFPLKGNCTKEGRKEGREDLLEPLWPCLIHNDR